MLIELKSVGSTIDDKTHIVYPTLKEGGIDSNCGVYLPECDIHWFGSLSDADWDTVCKITLVK